MSESKDFVKRLGEFLSFAAEQRTPDLDNELRELGYDPESVAKRGRDLSKQLYQAALKEKWKHLKESREAADLSIVGWKSKTSYNNESDVDRVLSEIKKGVFGNNAQTLLAAHFKNFDKATFEDKISLLRDIEFLIENEAQK